MSISVVHIYQPYACNTIIVTGLMKTIPNYNSTVGINNIFKKHLFEIFIILMLDNM